MPPFRILSAAIVFGATAVACSPARWAGPAEGRLTYAPICAGHRAPALGNVPETGLTPAYLFRVNDAAPQDQAAMRERLIANGFAVAPGNVTINGSVILFAVGEGALKTQRMADNLFYVICGLETRGVQLVHVRYNHPHEANRMN